MKSDLKCIPCILNFCLRTLDFCQIESIKKEKIFRKILNEIRNFSLEKSPASISSLATGIIQRETGIIDPYKEEKRKQNERALQYYPLFKKLVRESEFQLKAAFKLSAIGNTIDLGASHGNYDMEGTLHNFHNIMFAKEDFDGFHSKLKDAKTLLFIADNCGEIIFDRVLLEELTGIRKIVSVKSGPFINDVTVGEIKETGIDKIAEVIETGTSSPDLNEDETGEEFNNLFRDADIIISKGHANFEALHGTRADIYFLLKAKCDVVASLLGVKKGDFVFSRFA